MVFYWLAGKSRHQIQREIKEKNAAQEKLARTYSRPGLSPDDIKHCLYSINDNNSYLTQSRDPVDTMIEYLKRYFRPDSSEKGYSLAIAFGQEGARLSHDHERQYHYVLQSLMLWREIAHGEVWRFCLSFLVPFYLRDVTTHRHVPTVVLCGARFVVTVQPVGCGDSGFVCFLSCYSACALHQIPLARHWAGLESVASGGSLFRDRTPVACQHVPSLFVDCSRMLPQAPHVGSAMRHILHKAQSKTGFWVGSSVVHLGDHNVPNALMFIDKYTQVPRILNPIVVVLRALDLTSDMMKNPDTVKCAG
jgi:hypothetical protein